LNSFFEKSINSISILFYWWLARRKNTTTTTKHFWSVCICYFDLSLSLASPLSNPTIYNIFFLISSQQIITSIYIYI
jgi:hypothetical protein